MAACACKRNSVSITQAELYRDLFVQLCPDLDDAEEELLPEESSAHAEHEMKPETMPAIERTEDMMKPETMPAIDLTTFWPRNRHATIDADASEARPTPKRGSGVEMVAAPSVAAAGARVLRHRRAGPRRHGEPIAGADPAIWIAAAFGRTCACCAVTSQCHKRWNPTIVRSCACTSVRCGIRERFCALGVSCASCARERIDVVQAYFPDSSYFGIPAAWLAGVAHRLRTRNNVGHWLTPLHRRLGRMLNVFTTQTLANCEAARQALLAAEQPRPNRSSCWKTASISNASATSPRYGSDSGGSAARRCGGEFATRQGAGCVCPGGGKVQAPSPRIALHAWPARASCGLRWSDKRLRQG